VVNNLDKFTDFLTWGKSMVKSHCSLVLSAAFEVTVLSAS